MDRHANAFLLNAVFCSVSCFAAARRCKQVRVSTHVFSLRFIRQPTTIVYTFVPHLSMILSIRLLKIGIPVMATGRLRIHGLMYNALMRMPFYNFYGVQASLYPVSTEKLSANIFCFAVNAIIKFMRELLIRL